MSTTMSEWLQWVSSTEAALGILLAVLGSILSGAFAWHQRNLARRERAADLFDRFYSLESYHAVVAPVYATMLKWYALPAGARTVYADTLCKGWAGRDLAPEIVSAWDPEYDHQAADATAETFEKTHFRDSPGTGSVTRHASLTAFLYFWVKLEAMLEARLVCRSLVQNLFAGPYSIYAQFIADFREAVVDHPGTGEDAPVWIGATRRLESFLLEVPPVPERIDWGRAPDSTGAERA